ncbi:hypothetical protein EYF80_032250 [Liparis tanakae]|uniref:Uncharacterized protein n=1 Tax=Liparis tanakae TaxID=230148 RepID=A0A4Z2GVH3_9TELE|nr:hypothetical protein EYF80_032250 [Liparis tanakae]
MNGPRQFDGGGGVSTASPNVLAVKTWRRLRRRAASSAAVVWKASRALLSPGGPCRAHTPRAAHTSLLMTLEENMDLQEEDEGEEEEEEEEES